MPGFDRTGPEGKGSMTGRGDGRCSQKNLQQEGQEKPVEAIPLGRGMGRGLGKGMGLSQGRRPRLGLGRERGRGFGNRNIEPQE